MTMTQSSSQYFEKIAGEWDAIRSGYFTEAVRETAIAKAYLRPEMVVADVGSGTGFMAAGLAPLVQKIHVLDGSASMIAVAKKNLVNLGNKIEYHVADGQSLPLPDNSQDAVFANMYLHHCADPLAAIQEMVRILKPGGRLIITDMDTHSYEWLKAEMADVWMGFERTQIKDWYRQADLVNLVVDCTGQSCCAESSNGSLTDEQGRSAKISIFVASGTKRLTMRENVQQAYTSTAVNGKTCNCDSQNGSCCSGEPGQSVKNLEFNTGYSPEDKAAVPPEAESFSLGCGNPFAMANIKPGDTILDIGSGGGMDSFLAASKVGAKGNVIGVDMTPAMLQRARMSAEKSGIHNVEFRQGFAEALPLEDETVDVVISNCVVNLCEDKGRVFQEAFRVLKPGGQLELSDMVTSGPLSMDARYNSEGWSECLTGALPEAEYLNLIAQAGFNINNKKRSTSAGEVSGTSIYSMIISAIKEPKTDEAKSSCGCCC